MAFRADRWAFLRPWLAPVRGRLFVEPQEHLQQRKPRSKRIEVVLLLPGRNEVVTPKLVRGMRDALVLLSLVARVDCQAWAHVATVHCGVGNELGSAMTLLEDGQFDELLFSIALPHADGFENESMAEMITELIDNTQTSSHDGHLLSVAVSQLLMRAPPDSPLRQEPRVNIPMGVYLNVSRFSSFSRILWSMLLARHDRAGCWRFPVRLATANAFRDLGLDCGFVLGPLIVGTSGGSISTSLAQLLDDIATKHGSVVVDNMAITTGLPEDEREDNAKNAQALGRLYERLLCAGTCPDEQRATNRSIELFIGENNEFEVARVLTAVAQTRTTKRLSLHFDDLLNDGSEESRRRIWQSIAFAVFSRFARANSSITNVELTWPSFTHSDASVVVEMLESLDPVRLLLGPSILPNSELTPDYDHLTVKLTRGTSVTLLPLNDVEDIPEESATWELTTDVIGVLLDDTGKSTVLVLLPGYGPCRVGRHDLVSLSPLKIHSNGVADLSIVCVSEDDPNACSGLTRLLQFVGKQLTRLSLDFVSAQPPPLQDVLMLCPNLEVLDIKSDIVSSDSLVKASLTAEARLSDISCVFDEPFALMTELSKCHSKLAQCLKGLTYIIPEPSVPWLDPEFEIVSTMLRYNQTLEYLKFIVPLHFVQDFEASSITSYHMGRLPVIGEPLPLSCRLALLSVLSPLVQSVGKSKTNRTRLEALASLTPLDHGVIKNIFDFAASRAYRRVVITTREW